MQDETPQLEDGYTRLANELFDAILAFPFSGRQLKVLMTIVRKTYGYNKKRDDMSASQIAALCGVARPHVVKTLGELAEMHVILKESGKFGSVIEINKKYREWASTDSVSPSTELVSPEPSTKLVSPSTELVLVPNQYHVIPKRYSASTKTVPGASTKSVHTKDNLPKDNQQKNTSPSAPDSLPDGFIRFWQVWPSSDRKVAKAKCAAIWKRANLELVSGEIISHVESMKGSRQWLQGYEPAPLTYLNQSRWQDGEPNGQANVFG